MEKNILTSADIETLKGASKKVKGGMVVIGVLSDNVIKKEGEVKTVKDFEVQEKRPISSTYIKLIGSGIAGTLNPEAIKEGQKKTSQKKPFSLKRSFFALLDKIETEINYRKLQLEPNFYDCDSLGRVYLKDLTGAIYYVNKDKSACMSPTGEYFMIENNELIAKPELDNTYFSYLYISHQKEREGYLQLEMEDEEALEQFCLENPVLPQDIDSPQTTSSNIIDLDMYREKMEEKGPRR